MKSPVKSETKRTYNTALRRELAQMTRQRIIDAAQRLLVRGTYSSVTMEDIAREAGVAYQTVYSVFGTKLRLAHAMIDFGLHLQGVDDLVAQARAESDPEVASRIGARIMRRLNEPCADLIRFMRESGDPDLLGRHHEMEARRFNELSYVPGLLAASGRLRPTLSASEAHDVIWALSSPDWYIQLVFVRRWTPARYEEWLGDAFINLLLQPKSGIRRADARRGGA